MQVVCEADSEARSALLHGTSKAAQQKLLYDPCGLIGNHFNSQVFFKHKHPVDLARLHLGFKDISPEQSFTNLWVSKF